LSSIWGSRSLLMMQPRRHKCFSPKD
jgi:hypothetical protein